MPPRVTVYMPVRNGEAYVGAAIKSVLAQTFADFRLWVVENGSTDGTVAAVEKISDPRLTLVRLGSAGLTGALDFVLQRAETPLIARMDADDLVLPDRLKIQLDFLDSHPNVDFVGTAYAHLTPFGHVFAPTVRHSREITKRRLACYSRFFADASVMFRREAGVRAGGADTEFTLIDLVPFLFRLLQVGRGWELRDTLYIARMQQGSTSRQTLHGHESRAVRKKYAPEHISCGAHSASPPTNSFWARVMSMELLTGDSTSVLRARKLMEEECDGLGLPVKSYRLDMLPVPMAALYYRMRMRRRYRHRPDIEQLLNRYQ